eukprot:CAMPEP_0185027618 /NCGR_PEP_ID=MMETSP1103-20130426/12880_1 /TAXON_ID=36769 /ORGANISM="Paraphysomonas bandaiensis, Strain Caron Lab Isolate" /LENGTH=294 /DNA_ID=CAMNT_0027561711 /DNA_START=66 /DNA_END=950 /DNA_ORIENTATION=-
MTACVCISLDIFNIESSISDISRSDKVLLVIPGIGFHTNRTETVLWNLDILRRSNVSYQCIAFAYKIPPLKKTDLRIRSSCHLHYYFNGNYASYMKAIVPSVLNSAGFTHVMVLLDDVELGRHFSLDTLLDAMKRNSLAVATPAVTGAAVHSITPYEPKPVPKFRQKFRPNYKVGHTVKVMEVFATMFTLQAWKCWWLLLEPKLNSLGWYYDLCIYDYCAAKVEGFRMGVLMGLSAIHRAHYGKLSVNTSLHAMQMLGHPALQGKFWIRVMAQRRGTDLLCSHTSRHSRGTPLK